MAILTKLEAADAAALAHEFGVRAVRFTPIEAGSVNTNGRVETAEGKSFFLRVYEEQTDLTARHEAGLLVALARAGVPTPIPLRRVDGAGYVTAFAGKPVALFPFLPGAISCQRGVTAERARAVGAALARVHEAGDAILAGDLGKHVGAGRFGRAALEQRLAGLRGASLDADVAEARHRLGLALSRPPVHDPGRIGFIHGDLFRDNVLFAPDGALTLLDFESASRGPIAFDLAVTVLAWCFGDDLDADLGRAMIDGYRRVQPLDDVTRAAIFDEALFACHRFATTRITDFELRPAGSGRYKDFRRWLAREDTLLRLGREGLRGALFGG